MKATHEPAEMTRSTLAVVSDAFRALDHAYAELDDALEAHVASLSPGEAVQFLKAFPWQDSAAARQWVPAYLTQMLAEMPYADYLRTEHWAATRLGALDRAQHRCQTCSCSSRLQVHHRTYDQRGREAPDDLTVLCGGCHKTFHEHRRLVRD